MVKTAAEDRRIYIRAKRVLSIQFRLFKSKIKNLDRTWHLSTTYDMSVGGIAFYTDKEFRKGDILEVEVVMSGVLNIFKGFGKVVRVERKKGAAYFLIALKLINKKGKREAKTYVSRSSFKKVSKILRFQS